MKEGRESSSAQETHGKESEYNDSGAGQKRSEAEKPFEKAVRKANESQRKKPEAEEGQAELAAHAAMDLQQLVKSGGKGDRPVIELKELTSKQAKGLAEVTGPAVFLAQGPANKGAKSQATPAEGEAGELLSAMKLKTQANHPGQASEAQGQQKVLLKANADEARTSGEAPSGQAAGDKASDAALAKEPGALAGKATLQTDASSQVQAGAAREAQTEDNDARQLEHKTISVSDRQDGEDSMARVATQNAVQGPGQTQMSADSGSSRLGSAEQMDGLGLQVETTTAAGGSNSPGSLAVRAAHSNQASQMAGAHESEVAQSVVRQVGNYMQTQRLRAGDEMVLRLDPPELGSVKMTLEGKGNQLRMVVEASNPRTLVDLQREAPALMQRLTDSGIEVRRMEFAQSDPSGSGGSFGSLNRQGAQGQGAFDQQDGSPRPGRGPLMDASAEESASTSPAASVIGDQAINLWM